MNTVSYHSSQTQPEVLYGTHCFQVRLWSLEPGAILEALPFQPAKRSQSFLIRGEVTAKGLGAPQTLPLGQQLETSQAAPWQLQNTGTSTATLLEICEGSGFTSVPLQEVTDTRPWGSFTVLKDEPHYKLKQLIAKPGNRLSLQRHEKREEHWIVTAGKPEITLNDNHILMEPGQYIKVPRHSWHRLANPAPADSGNEVEIIELQLGEYFGEDDIERREDDYGRA